MWPWRNTAAPVSGTPKLQQLILRPTRLGVGLLVMVGLLWLVGLQYQVNLAYAVAFWLLGFWLVALLLNLRQLLALRIESAMPHEVFAGGTAQVQLLAEGNTRHRWLWLCSQDDFQADPTAAAIWHSWNLLPKNTQPFTWPVPAGQRGYLRLPSLHTASMAPFGLSLVECVWAWQTEIVVYPAPIAHTPDELPNPHGEQDASRPPLRGGDDLSYLQAHQDGMPLQHVAWKSYAKTGQLLDKRFEEPQAAVRSMVISYLDYPTGTGKDRLAGLLAHRLLAAERAGLPYILELPGRTIGTQKGQREIGLTALALW